MIIRNLTGVHCCGNICFDIAVWPADQFRWSATQWVETIEETTGGNGGNTAYTLARFGVPVRLHGMLGRDAHGDRVQKVLAAAGVDTSAIGRSDRPTTTTICIVHPNADRLFFQQVGASHDVEPDHVRLTVEPPFSHFHLANLFSLPKVRHEASALLRRAREAGLSTSLDTGWDASGRWMEWVGPCLPYTDLFFVNMEEGGMITGAEEADGIAASLRTRGATTVIVKRGSRGCVLFCGSEAVDIPGHDVKAVDTTGAGDAFAGGFLAGLFRGMSYEESARLGNAAGALNVEKVGATSGIRTYEETVAWMRMQ